MHREQTTIRLPGELKGGGTVEYRRHDFLEKLSEEEKYALKRLDQRRKRQEEIRKFALTLLEQCKDENLSMAEWNEVIIYMRKKIEETTLRDGLKL